MEPKQKPVFELPKLIALDGKEITEDRLLEELTADRICFGGGHNCSSGGRADEEEIA